MKNKKYLSDLVNINKKARHYTLKCGGGYSSMGFDYCFKLATTMANEVNRPDLLPKTKGTKTTYIKFRKLSEIVLKMHQKNGFRSQADLTPQLIGREGQRVEVVDRWGNRKRFWVGRSTGWIPCHLEIARTNCHGGGAVIGAPFSEVITIRTGR